MNIFDVDKTVKSIVHPFAEVMKTFTVQMNQLHEEVKETNRLLSEMLELMKEEDV